MPGINIGQINPFVLYALFIWSLIWKGLALWRAVKGNQKNWYVVLLVLNTAGILEITYLFFFAKQKMTINNFPFWKK